MDEQSSGTWALITCGVKQYIAEFDGRKDEVVATIGVRAARARQAFDHPTPMNMLRTPDGGMGAQKIPVTMPHDLMLNLAPVYFRIDMAVFFEDMQEADRASYKALVEQAVAQMQQSRAQQSGIALAGNDTMQKLGLHKRA